MTPTTLDQFPSRQWATVLEVAHANGQGEAQDLALRRHEVAPLRVAPGAQAPHGAANPPR